MANEDPNPYHRDPPVAAATAESVGVAEISTAECWRLVESNTLGRLAVRSVDGNPDVFPLNYLVHEGSLLIRSAPGTKLRSIASHPGVALEIDGVDGGSRWSVVIRGTATRMDTDAVIEASGILGLVSSSPTVKRNYVRLVPDTVTGRRFPVRRSASDQKHTRSASADHPSVSGERTVRRDLASPRTADKPRPIPHVRPWGGS